MTTCIRTTRNLLMATLIAAPLAWAPAAMADSQGMETEAPDIDVSSAEVESFAAAMLDVQQLGQEWTQRMQETDDQEELSEMQQEAQEEMIGAIEDHGMTVEEYNEIATAAQQDPELAQEIQQAAE
jgi:hypothetical protein